MNWKLRAGLLRAMATLPGGYRAYQFFQRHFGFHCDPSFYRDKLKTQRDIARLVLDSGGRIEGARVMEVGTGWLPLTTVGFWICGAEKAHTFDVRRHLLPGIFGRALRWMTENEDELVALWDGVAAPDRVVHCLATIRVLNCRARDVLTAAHIAYEAPVDAAATALADESIDIHYSTNVLEHVPPAAIAAILREANRLLGSEGRSIHIVDPRDHFALSDDTISKINFLQFSESQWQHYGGNYLAYHNRLRDPAFHRMFQDAGFELLEHRFEVDTLALQALKEGFQVAPEFRELDGDELCRQNLQFLGRPIRAS